MRRAEVTAVAASSPTLPATPIAEMRTSRCRARPQLGQVARSLATRLRFASVMLPPTERTW